MGTVNEQKNTAETTDRIILTERQIEAIRLSRLDIKNRKFIENKLLDKEVKIWLRNR